MLRSLVNFAGFQLCWLACVLGAANGQPVVGVVVVAVWAALHLRFAGAPPAVELRLMAAAAAAGILGDSALVVGGFVEFPAHARLGGPTTAWMVALWVAFSTTLGHSLGWLRGRLALGAATGAVAGPLAYWAGSKLGGITLLDGTMSLAAVGVLWMLATPALLATQQRLERTTVPVAEARG